MLIRPVLLTGGFSLQELYRDAAQPGFLCGTGRGAQNLGLLYERIERLHPQQVKELLTAWQDAAGACWGGQHAVAAHLQILEVWHCLAV